MSDYKYPNNNEGLIMTNYQDVILKRISNLKDLYERYEQIDKTGYPCLQTLYEIDAEIGVLEDILNGKSDIFQWERRYEDDLIISKSDRQL